MSPRHWGTSSIRATCCCVQNQKHKCTSVQLQSYSVLLTGDTGKCRVEDNDAGWLSNAAAFFCVENKSLCILQEIIATVSFGLNDHKSNWWVDSWRRTVWTLEKSLLLLHRRGKNTHKTSKCLIVLSVRCLSEFCLFDQIQFINRGSV